MKKKAQEAAALAAAEMEKLRVATEAATPAAAAADEPVDKGKRLKKLNKSLKAVEALKEKKKAGEKLNEDQEAKLGTEDGLRAEIAELEALP